MVGSPVAVETTAGEVTLPEFNALQTTNAYDPPPIVPELLILPVAQIRLHEFVPPLIIPPELTVIEPLIFEMEVLTTMVPLTTKFPPILTVPPALKVDEEFKVILPLAEKVPELVKTKPDPNAKLAVILIVPPALLFKVPLFKPAVVFMVP